MKRLILKRGINFKRRGSGRKGERERDVKENIIKEGATDKTEGK